MRRETTLTWPYGHSHTIAMKSIAAGKFKDRCLKTLDEVASSKSPVVITKRGRPVAKLVPYVDPAKKTSLAGSVLKEIGDPFGTGAPWDADADAP
jgi:prevent-host-death family protein